MRVDQLFPSKYLRAADLDGDTVVTIQRVTQQDLKGEPKPILVLRDSKDLVLNKTNSKTIAKLHGDEIDGWSDKQITLFPTTVDFGGDLVPGIRIRSEFPINNASETITKQEAEALKTLYRENAWPIPEVQRMLTEVANCASLTSIPRDKYAELKECFGRDFEANDMTEDEEVPF